MVLWLGLDPAPWLRPDSHLMRAKWKQQKTVMSHVLDVILAAVYLDGGMAAAEALAWALLDGTPPLKHQQEEYMRGKRYPPEWVNKY